MTYTLLTNPPKVRRQTVLAPHSAGNPPARPALQRVSRRGAGVEDEREDGGWEGEEGGEQACCRDYRR